jgi:hypothetical protein
MNSPPLIVGGYIPKRPRETSRNISHPLQSGTRIKPVVQERSPTDTISTIPRLIATIARPIQPVAASPRLVAELRKRERSHHEKSTVPSADVQLRGCISGRRASGKDAKRCDSCFESWEILFSKRE